MTSQSETTDPGPILRFLGRVDRRLRMNDALGGLTRGLWGLLGLLVVVKLAGLWDGAGAGTLLILIYGAALAGVVGWLYARRGGLGRSATLADTRADLKDALKSALSFIGLPERTPWMELQIRRTARAAEELDAAEVAPRDVPRSLPWAAGLGVGLLALLAWSPSWLQGFDAPSLWPESAEEPALTAEVFEEDEAAAEAVEEEREELETAMERLRERDLELIESLRDLEESQEALAASRVDMEQLEQDLDRMGDELSTIPALSELGEALQGQDAEKAAELLRELAERLSEAQSSEELQALLEALQNADVQQGDLASLMESLENASAEPQSERSLAEMAELLEQAANQLEQMGQQQMSPQQLDSMGQEMQSLEAGLGQQQAAGQQQAGQQQQQQGGQATQSASGAMSTQLQMAQMQGDPSSAFPVDAGPAGDATGPGGGEEQVLGEATTLDVQLEMEVLETEPREEPVPEEIFERLSREEKSTLNYEAVEGRGGYAKESALGRESVPWQYRSLVKRYFLSILSNSETTSEPSPEK